MLESPLRFAPPPRRVPFSIGILSSLNAVAQIGFAVFGFGSIFFWAFASNADFSFVTFRGAIGRAAGVVTRVVETNASESRRRIQANHYEYSVAGRTFRGVSYTTGGSVAQGEPVTVEYKLDAPESSRIEGQRRKMFGPGVAFVTLFPLVGLLLAYGGTRWGGKRARLLRDGVFTTGVLTRKSGTNTYVNRRRVYELTFEFTARDGRKFETKARTSDTARLEDERQEPLLYDPEDPAKAVLLDEAPARPRFDETGALLPRPLAAFFAMILPAVVIVANTLAVVARLLP